MNLELGFHWDIHGVFRQMLFTFRDGNLEDSLEKVLSPRGSDYSVKDILQLS